MPLRNKRIITILTSFNFFQDSSVFLFNYELVAEGSSKKDGQADL